MSNEANLVDARIEDFKRSDSENLQFKDQIASAVMRESTVAELFDWLNKEGQLNGPMVGQESTVEKAVKNTAYQVIQSEV